MVNYLVVLEVPIVLKNVGTRDDAANIAIAQVGKQLKRVNLEYVKIEIGASRCPNCSGLFNSAFVVGKMGLVGVYLSMKVFNAETVKHAENIAKSAIGRALKDVPLKTFEVRQIKD
ncbi:MAG: DUF555 domain-containing protein [Candidatus Dojkabacteria bacterium]|jgi:uncharacterized protein (UPF0212 family)|nr:DUF555 domain-containing protein [Candidatus Methanofastidiosa archaeon]MDD4280980.1 DUF555 domain-containing protein [Candidatus Methanofastidiosa archaeon]